MDEAIAQRAQLHLVSLLQPPVREGVAGLSSRYGREAPAVARDTPAPVQAVAIRFIHRIPGDGDRPRGAINPQQAQIPGRGQVAGRWAGRWRRRWRECGRGAGGGSHFSPQAQGAAPTAVAGI